jgi:hypothetical protein
MAKNTPKRIAKQAMLQFLLQNVLMPVEALIYHAMKKQQVIVVEVTLVRTMSGIITIGVAMIANAFTMKQLAQAVVDVMLKMGAYPIITIVGINAREMFGIIMELVPVTAIAAIPKLLAVPQVVVMLLAIQLVVVV